MQAAIQDQCTMTSIQTATVTMDPKADLAFGAIRGKSKQTLNAMPRVPHLQQHCIQRLL